MEAPLTPPIASQEKESPAPTRSGACPFCLRKHLLKAAGYAEEMREELNREWEREKLIQNLLLAEDHAAALGDWSFRSEIRAARVAAEDGGIPDIEPLLARAREKILELHGVVDVGNKGEGTTIPAAPAKQ